MSLPIVHIAAEPDATIGGIQQKCSRCSCVLVEHAGLVALDGRALSLWPTNQPVALVDGKLVAAQRDANGKDSVRCGQPVKEKAELKIPMCSDRLALTDKPRFDDIEYACDLIAKGEKRLPKETEAKFKKRMQQVKRAYTFIESDPVRAFVKKLREQPAETEPGEGWKRADD